MSLNSLTVKELRDLQRFNNRSKCIRLPQGTRKSGVINRVNDRMKTNPSLRKKANELIKAREERKNKRIAKALGIKRKPKKRKPKKRVTKKRKKVRGPTLISFT